MTGDTKTFHDDSFYEKNNINWLKDNISSVLAIAWLLFTFIIDTIVLTHAVKSTDNTTFLIINSVNNIMVIIVGYFFGSSIASKNKDEVIKKMTDGENSNNPIK